MPGAFSNILFHVVFSTKNRRPWITPDIQPRLYEYMGGITRGEKAALHAIGGMPDHVHLLIGWHTDEAISAFVRNLKSRSSKWIHQTFDGLKAFAWQPGYGVFSVSQSQSDRVRNYIRRQIEHHSKKDFRRELIELLKAHQVEYDERYFLRG